jgi:hypothetical protein
MILVGKMVKCPHGLLLTEATEGGRVINSSSEYKIINNNKT